MMSTYVEYLVGAAGLAIIAFVMSLAVIAVLLVSLPATFFLDSHVRDLWVDHHPVIRWAGHLVKNVLGAVVILLGLFLLVPGVPGQGLLTILVGMVLLDIPGKRRVERWLLSWPRVQGTIGRLRQRFNRPPFILEEPPPDSADGE